MSASKLYRYQRNVILSPPPPLVNTLPAVLAAVTMQKTAEFLLNPAASMAACPCAVGHRAEGNRRLGKAAATQLYRMYRKWREQSPNACWSGLFSFADNRSAHRLIIASVNHNAATAGIHITGNSSHHSTAVRATFSHSSILLDICFI